MGTDVAAADADLLHHILCARRRVRAGQHLRLFILIEEIPAAVSACRGRGASRPEAAIDPFTVTRLCTLLSLTLPDRYHTRFSPVFSAPYLSPGPAAMAGRKNPGQISVRGSGASCEGKECGQCPLRGKYRNGF